MPSYILSLILLFSSCSRLELPLRKNSMRVDNNMKFLKDDISLQDFQKALAINVKLLMRAPDKVLQFGPKKITSKNYAWALNSISKFKEKSKLLVFLKKYFNAMEVYGRERWGEILLTSYFEPLYPARIRPTNTFSQPIYKVPPTLVELDIQKLANKKLGAITSKRKVMGGRIIDGPGLIPRIVPFYSRKEIDSDKLLRNKKLELYYLDPIHAFFLQIQGSGALELKDGKRVRVGYAGQNGWKYESIGKYLFNVIPKEKMSLQRIEQYLRTLKIEELYNFLNKNPSYVFFKKLEGRGLTTFGNEVVSGRTLAVDNSYVPLGALGYLSFKKPFYKSSDDLEPTSFNETSRLVIAQDTGGAIKSPGRADLFWGEGDMALKYAGTMRHKAKLWFLVPKVLPDINLDYNYTH
ncbi:MAG: hypothetical protein HN576_16200 [Bacteriovoracaceae bacterium]|jgi:membrane-bound lytic murein transglycosylase A|nr:hypothetical protein [Bacteriovoracaceae bacterium]